MSTHTWLVTGMKPPKNPMKKRAVNAIKCDWAVAVKIHITIVGINGTKYVKRRPNRSITNPATSDPNSAANVLMLAYHELMSSSMYKISVLFRTCGIKIAAKPKVIATDVIIVDMISVKKIYLIEKRFNVHWIDYDLVDFLTHLMTDASDRCRIFLIVTFFIWRFFIIDSQWNWRCLITILLFKFKWKTNNLFLFTKIHSENWRKITSPKCCSSSQMYAANENHFVVSQFNQCGRSIVHTVTNTNANPQRLVVSLIILKK